MNGVADKKFWPIRPTAIPIQNTAHLSMLSCHQVNLVDVKIFIRKVYHWLNTLILELNTELFEFIQKLFKTLIHKYRDTEIFGPL